jgi:hypothetical protein
MSCENINEIQTQNLENILQFNQAMLTNIMEKAQKATVKGTKIEFCIDTFNNQFKGQLGPAIEAYLNIPSEDEGVINKTAFIAGETVGAVVETAEFTLSLLPFVGKSIYRGLKYGHVKTYCTHSKICNKVNNLVSSTTEKTVEKAEEFKNSVIETSKNVTEKLTSLVEKQEDPPIANPALAEA